ncbi:MAG TPA: pitrilysin family protein [Candidatus Ozemobacteraceae bacterium]
MIRSTRFRLLAGLVLVLALVAAAPLIAAEEQAKPALPKLEFEKYALPNGLQVILHVDKKLPVVHVNQWYHVGSKNEKRGRTGFAHLFEHLMFQGSKNAKGEYFTWVERAGANLREGGVNGTTGNDRTNYFATVPSGNLEYLLWLESDRMATLIEDLDEAKLNNQRDVVKNERRQSYENAPYGRAGELFATYMYPPDHPYSWPVIGSQEDLTAATLDDVKEFFRTYYTPNNMTLAITGDFDPAEAKKLVAKYFGTIPSGPALARPKQWIPELNAERVVEVADRVPQTKIYLCWHSPAYFGSQDAELDVAAAVLSDGLSSRLNKALVYDRQLCTGVGAYQDSMEIAGNFCIEATLRPDTRVEEVESIIDAEIARLAKEGPTAGELERVKNKIEFGFVSSLEAIGGFGGKADMLNKYNTYLGSPDKFAEDFERYTRLTGEDVRAAVARWIDNTKRVKMRFRPEKPGEIEQVAVTRDKAPELGQDRDFAPPAVKTGKLANGLEILVVERPELPKVAVSLTVRAGSLFDQPGKAGCAQLTMATIEMGTKTRKALEIEQSMFQLGTSLSSSAGRESAGLAFEVLKRNLAPALAIMADVALNPVFPAEEFERERKRMLDGMSQEENDPRSLAGRLRSVIAFGADHPYGWPANGFAATVRSLSQGDLVKMHADRFKPGNAALSFVGDITLDEAMKLAQETFGVWSAGSAPALELPAPKPAKAGTVYLIDKPGAVQTVVLQLLPGIKRADPAYYPLMLADAVWGSGGFGTRLNLNLREDKGYTYGARSALASSREAGSWFASASVQGNKTKESVVEFVKELENLGGKKPITEAELQSARETRLRGYAQRFDTMGKVASRIGELWALGLPYSEFVTEFEKTKTLGLADVNAAAATYASKSQALLLLIGDRAKIEPGIRELNLGEIVPLDAEGKPLK